MTEIISSNGLPRIKMILKEDKEEANTYWALVLLTILCGNPDVLKTIPAGKEESVNEALVHMQMEEVLVGLIKKHAEAPSEFHILVHQVLAHMVTNDKIVRKCYAKDSLFLSLIPLLDCADISIVQTALSILVIILMSVLISPASPRLGRRERPGRGTH